MNGHHRSGPAVAIAGWLFADLLLAFLIITLGMDAPVEPEPAPAAGQGAEDAEGAEGAEEPPHGLAADPIVVEVSGVSPAQAAAGDEEVVQRLRDSLAGHGLDGEEAGMVLTFGADGGAAAGEEFAEDVNGLLPEAYPGVFEGAATRTFHSLSGSPGWLRIEIYVLASTEAGG